MSDLMVSRFGVIRKLGTIGDVMVSRFGVIRKLGTMGDVMVSRFGVITTTTKRIKVARLVNIRLDFRD